MFSDVFMLFQRFFTRRGYGVQSPFAYHIVRNVICERTPFYAYEKLDSEVGKREDKEFLHLLLRLSNDLQPKTCFLLIDSENQRNIVDVLQKSILAGCKSCKIISFSAASSLRSDFIVVDRVEKAIETLENSLLNPDGCLIVKRNRHDEKAWNQLLTHPSAAVVFEMGKRHALIFYKERLSIARYHL